MSDNSESSGFSFKNKFSNLFSAVSSFFSSIFSEEKEELVKSKQLADWRMKTSEIFSRPTTELPIHKDLPRLAKKVIFADHRATLDSPDNRLPPDPVSPLEATADADVPIYDAVVDFMWKAAFILCGGRKAADDLRNSFKEVIKADVALDVQSGALKDFVAGLGEEHPVARLLKAVNQSIPAPANIEVHTKIMQSLLFKDSQKKPWNVFVHVEDGLVTVEHVRVQTNLNQQDVASFFEFTLVTRLVFDIELSALIGSDVFVKGYEFADTTTPDKKQSLEKIFKAAPKPAQTKDFASPPFSMAKVGVNIIQ